MPVKITDYTGEKSGRIRKNDLVKSPNLKKVFTSINQHLYGKLKYTDTDTRARSKQIVNLLLCKLVDEISKKAEEEVEFCLRDGESDKDLLKRISVESDPEADRIWFEEHREVFSINTKLS